MNTNQLYSDKKSTMETQDTQNGLGKLVESPAINENHYEEEKTPSGSCNDAENDNSKFLDNTRKLD